MDDPYDLARFVNAQDAGNTYRHALDELKRGRKVSHWMWFVFPQISGLGRSSMAQRYAIASLDEAGAYLAHPVLGPRLHNCATAVVGWAGQRSALDIFGGIDAVKLRSSCTLFDQAQFEDAEFDQAALDSTASDHATEKSIFAEVLEAFFDGPDPTTLSALGRH